MKHILVLFLLISLVVCHRRYQRGSWESRLTDAVFGATYEQTGQVSTKDEPTFKRFNQQEVPTITQWNYPLVDWAICSPSLVYAVTADGTILVSRDSLLTFTPVPAIPKGDNSVKIFHNEYFKNLLVVVGKNLLWISANTGETWTKYPQPYTFTDIVFHPTRLNVALSVVKDPVRGRILFVTENGGKDWKELIDEVSQYDWCRAGTGQVSADRICIIEANKFQYTNNLGKDWVTPLNVKAKFFNVHDRFFTLVGNENNAYHFYVSADDGTSFKRAILPHGVSVGDVDPRQFLEDSNGVIWIVVTQEAEKDKSQKGNLYTSDAEGFEFSLVLRDVHTYKGWWDIDLISFMEGTLFANTLLDEVSVHLRTKITYDNGDTWETLQAPERDIKGKKITCGKTCSLNLFGVTTWLGVGGEGQFGDFYTNPDAVGLIVGTGNVGNHLDINDKKINTYLSRDGGLSWAEIFDESTIYDFGDFGGLLVLGKNQAESKKIYYSWDGGKNFNSVELPRKVTIINIITISSHSESFIVVSSEMVDGIKIPRIFGVDFSRIHTRNCTTEDYEEWIPHNGVKGPKCVLGHNVVYRRRKVDSPCFTEEEINKVINITNCSCTDADYECDRDFDRTEGSGKCVYDGNIHDLDNHTKANGCGKGEKTYLFSSGYRKIPGDTCVGDLEKYAPTKRPCPTVTPSTPSVDPSGLSSVGVAIGMTLLVLVALVVGFFFGIRDERIRQMFPFLNSAPSWVTAGYSNSLLVEGDEFEEENPKSVDLSTSLSDDE